MSLPKPEYYIEYHTEYTRRLQLEKAVKERDRLKGDINKLATFLLDISPSGVPCGGGEGAIDVAIKYIKEAAYWVRKLEQERDEEAKDYDRMYEYWSKSERERIELKEQNDELVAALKEIRDLHGHRYIDARIIARAALDKVDKK